MCRSSAAASWRSSEASGRSELSGGVSTTAALIGWELMGKLFAAWELFVSWRSSSQHKRWWRVWWLCKSELKPCEIWKSCPAHADKVITGPIRMEEREFNEHYMINVSAISSLSVCKSWNSLKTIKIDKNDAFDNVQLLKMGRLWLKRVSIVLITARTLYAWTNL